MEHAPVKKDQSHPALAEPSVTPQVGKSFEGVESSSLVYPFGWDFQHHNVGRTAAQPAAEAASSSQVYPFAWNFSHKSAAQSSTTQRDLSSQVYPFDWDYAHQPKKARSLAATPLRSLQTLPTTVDGVETSSLVYPFGWNYDHVPVPRANRHAALDEPSSTPLVTQGFNGVDASSAVYPFGWDFMHHKMNKTAPTPSPVAPQRYPFRWDMTHESSSSLLGLDLVPPTPNRAQLPSAIDGTDTQSLVYPFRWNYQHQEKTQPSRVTLLEQYPNLVIYPSVYPHNLDSIYPTVQISQPSSFLSRQSSIPVLLPLPADVGIIGMMYPYNLRYIYPAGSPQSAARAVAQPALPSIPVLLPLPAQAGLIGMMYPYNLEYIYPATSSRSSAKAPSQPSPSPIPVLLPLPADAGLVGMMYPYNLKYIYPAVPSSSAGLPTRSTPSPIPVLLPLPAQASLIGMMYPHNLKYIYPAVSPRSAMKAPTPPAPSPIPVLLPLPSYIVLGAMYPYNLQHIYPTVARVAPSGGRRIRSRTAYVNKSLEIEYPTIEVYKPVYPHNLSHIYPAYGLYTPEEQTSSFPTSAYPFLVIYPSVYPFLEMYPTRAAEVEIKIEPVELEIPNSVSYFLSSGPRSINIDEVAMFEEEPYQEVIDSGFASRDDVRMVPTSAHSSYSDDFDLELPGPSRRLQQVPAAAAVYDDDSDSDYEAEATPALDEMDSPTRRFFLARQKDLRNSVDLTESEDDDDDADPFEFDSVPIPPMSFGTGRPSLSLQVPRESSSGFFDDEEEIEEDEEQDDDANFMYDDDLEMDFDNSELPTDEEMYAAYHASRPSRFPAPTLSAVTEESNPMTGGLNLPSRGTDRFPSPLNTNAPPLPTRSVMYPSPARTQPPSQGYAM
ncbi:hypothetical protein DL93DRAFT_2089180 [Clavulina sp. PMI_390]|nr:hypothetical protein DL93DRAFT_2089180 [Clavulina sp. PMI_390]